MVAAFLDINWEDISVGVAAILGLIYVTRTLRNIQDTTLKFLGNHLSTNTAAQQATADAMESTASVLATLAERVDRLHDDNIEAANRLKHADVNMVRKVSEQNMTSLTHRLNAIEDRLKKGPP